MKPSRFAPVLAALALAGGVAGCGSDDSSEPAGSGSGTSAAAVEVPQADAAQLERAAALAVAPGTDPTSLPEIAQEALRVAAVPPDAELEKQVFACMKTSACDTGRGDLVIGIAEPNAAVPYRKMLRAVFTLQALRYPNVRKIIYTDAAGDLSTFLSNFRSLVTQKADIITGNFDFASSMLPVVKQAAAQGILVIPFTQAVPGAKPGEEVLTTVQTDVCAYGKASADAAIDAAKADTGSIALLTGTPGNAYGAQWQPCAKKQIESRGWKVGRSLTTNWTPQGEKQSASALIASGDEVDAIIYDYTPEGLVNAYADAKRTPPAIIGGAGTVAYVKAANDAEEAGRGFPAYISNSQLWYATAVITAAIKGAADEAVPGEIVLPAPVTPIADLGDQYSPSLPAAASFNSLLPNDWIGRVLQD